MIRVTLKDTEQTISFLTTTGVARRLVAACAANPNAAGELLRATEIFQRGVAVAVMNSLMTFDKTLQQHGLAQAQQALNAHPESNDIVHGAFQVVNDETEALASSPAGNGLLILDLARRAITAAGDFTVEVEGEIRAHNGEALTDRSITYVLPKTWTVHSK